ncbi:hypothetical protein K504DRAFT_467787 [Pleomassaria siparia CBS 279.74]|uniref:Uncharacterized protein n=1 Tax=Pleomassaria siparia CBS 279.74 TaxID=1314801 RepID=A0A6G1JPK4_9PLEO|nr:hypothetical protein K504DRAFT_467787 [Pleomassaria siparia CBS 279.74]
MASIGVPSRSSPPTTTTTTTTTTASDNGDLADSSASPRKRYRPVSVVLSSPLAARDAYGRAAPKTARVKRRLDYG